MKHLESRGRSFHTGHIVRQITTAARAKIQQIKKAKDLKQTIHQGAADDNR